MIEKSDQEHSTLHRIWDIVILFGIAVTLFLAQSASWLNHTIFDKDTFTSTVTPIVQSAQSRQAIASTITAKAFASKPLINQLLGDNVTALISGLLATDTAQQMMSNLVDRSYTYLTSNNPQPIAINLVPVKVPLQAITQILENRGQDVSIDPNSIPNTITLFDPSNLPDIYGYSVMLLWFGPLCWIGFILLAILYIYLGRARYARRVYTLGGVVILVACVGLLIGPLLPPPVSATVPIPELRPIISQIITALIAPFTSQMITTIIVTAVVLIIFYSRFAIVRGAQWVIQKTAAMTSTTPRPAGSKK